MPPIRYVVRVVKGLQVSDRRGIAFIEYATDAAIDAHTVFDGLDDSKDRQVRTRFDYWISGGIRDEWFHGFQDDYKDCFTFKWKEQRQHHRFYGFLSHARPLTNPRFQACVLPYHATKNTAETDYTILGWCLGLLQNPDVVRAIINAFREEEAT